MNICVELFLEYHVLLAPGVEDSPVMDFWLTRNVSNAWKRVELSSSGQGRTRINLELPLTDNFTMAALEGANLNIDTWAFMSNKHYERCLIPAGVAVIPLQKVMQDSGVDAALIFPMLDADSGGVKGSVNVRGTNLLVRGMPLPKTFSWNPRKLKISPLEEYIVRAEANYGPDGMPSTWKSLVGVNMFRYVNRVCVLPAASYVRSLISVTGEEFFVNAANLALKRLRLTPEKALAWNLDKSKDDAYTAACWLAHALSIYPQYCDYVSDVVMAPVPLRDKSNRVAFEEVGIEWFQYVRHRDAGDCEDLATESIIIARELERLQTQHPLLKLLQKVRSAFFITLLLDGVSSVEINLSTAQGNSQHMDAHMNSALISKAFVRNWTTSIDQARLVGANPIYPSIIMLEGTGPLNPDGRACAQGDDIAEELREQLLRVDKLLGSCVRQVFHYSFDQKHNNFYQAVKLMATPDMSDNTFIWTLHPSKTSPTAGITFQQIAAGSSDIKAMPEVPFSDEELQVMDYYMLDLHPLPALQPPKMGADAPAHVQRARKQMEQLSKQLAEVVNAGRAELMAPRGPGPRVAHTTVVMIKYQHFDAHQQFISRFLEAVRAAQRARIPLVDIKVHEEAITDTRGGFRVQLMWPEMEVDKQRTAPINRHF